MLSFRGSRCRCRCSRISSWRRFNCRGMTRYVRRYSKAAPQATLSETNSCWRFLMFAAVIEGPSQGELAVTTDQHCALQMTEIEQEESFLLVDVRIGNFERVKRTNLRQLH